MEKTQKIIALVMEKIRGEVDPLLLDKYHLIFKKEVSLFHRSKVAAYLLMMMEQGKSVRSLEQDFAGQGGSRQKAAGRNGSAKPERGGSRKPKGGNERHSATVTVARSESPDPQRYPLADEDSKWLFFSVGRSRRISPREILSLINTKTSLPKDDIGAIRIFDNYSFVQVRDTVAETIIEALGGYVFRGRALVVNHAKSRKGEGNGAADEVDESFGELPPPAEAAGQDVSAPVEDSAGEIADAPDVLERQEDSEPQEKDT